VAEVGRKSKRAHSTQMSIRNGVTLLRVDTSDDRMLPVERSTNWNARFVTSSGSHFLLALPRRLRGMLALFVLTTYLFGGVLHGLCDLDVTNVSVDAVMALAEKGTAGHSDSGVIADHHCHGCFSVSVPAPAIGAGDVMPTEKVIASREIGHRGLTPGLDPPPPKFLT